LIYCNEQGGFIENCPLISNEVFGEQPDYLFSDEEGNLHCYKCLEEDLEGFEKEEKEEQDGSGG
jgi:hypothetical protein